MKTKIIDIMVNAVEAMIASINKNTAPINEGKKPATFKSANRYGDSWLATGKCKCDNKTPPTKE